jgi:hypothetical protein
MLNSTLAGSTRVKPPRFIDPQQFWQIKNKRWTRLKHSPFDQLGEDSLPGRLETAGYDCERSALSDVEITFLTGSICEPPVYAAIRETAISKQWPWMGFVTFPNGLVGELWIADLPSLLVEVAPLHLFDCIAFDIDRLCKRILDAEDCDG